MEVLPDFDKEVIDGDDTINTDIKINPDYYIHHAITGAQEMLKKDDMKQGFIQYWSMIEHIEILASSASMLPDDYEKKITEFSNKEENKAGDVLIQKVKVANFKLQLILSEIFKKKTITSPLKVEEFLFKKDIELKEQMKAQEAEENKPDEEEDDDVIE